MSHFPLFLQLVLGLYLSVVLIDCYVNCLSFDHKSCLENILLVITSGDSVVSH